MEISCTRENNVLSVALAGRLDSNTVHELETTLKEEMNGIEELVFDLKNLEYLSSAGLRVILASHKLMSGNMEIKNANQTLMGIFEMTGMSTFLNIARG